MAVVLIDAQPIITSSREERLFFTLAFSGPTILHSKLSIANPAERQTMAEDIYEHEINKPCLDLVTEYGHQPFEIFDPDRDGTQEIALGDLRNAELIEEVVALWQLRFELAAPWLFRYAEMVATSVFGEIAVIIHKGIKHYVEPKALLDDVVAELAGESSFFSKRTLITQWQTAQHRLNQLRNAIETITVPLAGSAFKEPITDEMLIQALMDLREKGRTKNGSTDAVDLSNSSQAGNT